jgi:hypothetical protein
MFSVAASALTSLSISQATQASRGRKKMKEALLIMKGEEDEEVVNNFKGEIYEFDDKEELLFTYKDLTKHGYKVWNMSH